MVITPQTAGRSESWGKRFESFGESRMTRILELDLLVA